MPSVKQFFHFWLLTPFLLVAGCSGPSFTIVSRQQITTPIPDTFPVDATPHNVYTALLAQAKDSENSSILVADPQTGLVTWLSNAHSWRDLAADTVNDSNDGFTATALTTAWITGPSDTDPHSRLYLHITYVSKDSVGGVAPSSGIAETDLAQRIIARLKQTPNATAAASP